MVRVKREGVLGMKIETSETTREGLTMGKFNQFYTKDLFFD